MAKRSAPTKRTIKRGQDTLVGTSKGGMLEVLTEETSQDLPATQTRNIRVDDPMGSIGNAPKAWWDVTDPKAYFGVQGNRTNEQKERVQQFRQEWGNVRGAAAVTGLIDGTYTADQLIQNWGAENLASVIKAESFEVGEFNEGDNFGSYLQSEFDNVSSFINPSGEGVRGTLGTIDTALNQGSGGPKGTSSYWPTFSSY